MTRLRWLVVLALSLLTACASSNGQNGAEPTVAPTSASTATPTPTTSSWVDSYYHQKLKWHGCGSGFQCSTLTVPLDYSNQSAGTISIAVARLKASGSKRGSILVNPGGPGGSGIDYAKQKPVTKRIREHYDLIGF